MERLTERWRSGPGGGLSAPPLPPPVPVPPTPDDSVSVVVVVVHTEEAAAVESMVAPFDAAKTAAGVPSG